VSTVFVDTNVLLYALDESEPDKQPLADAWIRRLWERRAGRISVQVLQDFYVNAIGLDPGLAPTEARVEVEAFAAWNPITNDSSLLRSAWEIEDRAGFSFWDSLIVAAAQRAGCDVLLTEDLQDGQVVDGLTVVDPFRHAPESILETPARDPVV